MNQSPYLHEEIDSTRGKQKVSYATTSDNRSVPSLTICMADYLLTTDFRVHHSDSTNLATVMDLFAY